MCSFFNKVHSLALKTNTHHNMSQAIHMLISQSTNVWITSVCGGKLKPTSNVPIPVILLNIDWYDILRQYNWIKPQRNFIKKLGV